MAEQADQEDRTETATARRLEQSRQDGLVPISRECVALATLGTATLALCFLLPAAVHDVGLRLARFLSQAHEIDLTVGSGAVLRYAGIAVVRGAAPMVLAVLVGGVGAVVLQSGMLFHAGALTPKLSRLDPRTGLKRIFGVDGLVETLKSLAKLAAMIGATWFAVGKDFSWLADAVVLPTDLLLGRLSRLLLRVILTVLAAQTVIAMADLLWVRLRHARSLRMSREQIREEQKDMEGDPRIKARIKQIRMQRARRRMVEAIAKANVVVTNPTHYAVALTYDRGKNAAPRVVAKGVDAMAAQIRKLAREHNVPLVANPPLARALHRIELDTEIPPEHYKAVAEIFAYIWGLGRRAAGARAGMSSGLDTGGGAASSRGCSPARGRGVLIECWPPRSP